MIQPIFYNNQIYCLLLALQLSHLGFSNLLFVYLMMYIRRASGRTLPCDRCTRYPSKPPALFRFSHDANVHAQVNLSTIICDCITSAHLYIFENRERSNWRFRSTLYRIGRVAYFVSRRVDRARMG